MKLTRNLFTSYNNKENQLTHAFVSLLEISFLTDQTLFQNFLNLLGKDINLSAETKVQFGIQRRPVQFWSEDGKYERISMPDAYIVAQDQAIVLIENKIVAAINSNQLFAHLQLLSAIPENLTRILLYITPHPSVSSLFAESEVVTEFEENDIAFKFLSWFEVARKLRRDSKDTSPTMKILIAEFLEFVGKVIPDLMEFTGFTEEDFQFFTELDEMHRALVKTRMEQLKQTLGIEMDEELRKQLPKVHLTPIRASKNFNPWMVFSQFEQFAYNPHFSVAFQPEGVSVWLNMETKPATSKFLEKMENNKDNLYSFLRDLRNYFLEIEERTYVEKVPAYKWPIRPVLRLNLNNLSSSIFASIEDLITSIDYPIIMLRRNFRIDNESEWAVITSKRIVEELISFIRTLMPFHDFLNI